MRNFSVERLGPGPLHHRKRLEEAPLVTKAFREAQMKEKLERYPKVSKDSLKFLWGNYGMPTGHHHMGQVFPG